MKKDDLPYEAIILTIFNILIDIYGVDKAILLIYEINKLKGEKI